MPDRQQGTDVQKKTWPEPTRPDHPIEDQIDDWQEEIDQYEKLADEAQSDIDHLEDTIREHDERIEALREKIRNTEQGLDNVR